MIGDFDMPTIVVTSAPPPPPLPPPPYKVNKKAELAYDSLDYAAWPMGAQVKLGAALIRFLLETACWTENQEHGVAAWKQEGAGEGEEEGVGLGQDGTPQPAFVHEVVKRGKKQQGNLSLAPEVYKQVRFGFVGGFLVVCWWGDAVRISGDFCFFFLQLSVKLVCGACKDFSWYIPRLPGVCVAGGLNLRA